MNIIIIGDGKVGYSLAENLSKEDHDVTIIDKNPEALKKADENLDVMCIKGNGLSAKTLLEAGVKTADLLIAATSSDEMNMVCALTGKKLGAANTVARIRDPEYANELNILKEELGLNLIINPEQAAAREISRLLRFPSAADVEPFAKGRVELAEIKATRDMPIIGMPLSNISKKISSDVLIGAIHRGDEIIIPNGSTVIHGDDDLFIFGKPSDVFGFCKQIGKVTQKIKHVLVVGGGRIAYYLTLYLKQSGIKVKIVESNRERCLELAEPLPDTLIIHGDGTDDSLLKSENLSDLDAFVSLTGRDEENLVSALLAKQHGVKKVITKITRFNYPEIVRNMGIDSIVNPKLITTNYILRYVRGLNGALGNPVESVYKIIGGNAETLEFIANHTTKFLNVPLKRIKFVEGVMVASIARKNEIIIPHGNDEIKIGDSVIIITKGKQFSDFNEIIEWVGE